MKDRRDTLAALAEPARDAPRRTLGGRIRGAFADNLPLKLLSIILALTVYLLVNTDESREINARVRVAYVLPADKALVSERVDEVRVTIRGPWRRIKRFDEREIDRIDVDLTGVASGGEVTITPEMIEVPRGLEITSIEPRVVRVAFEDIATKQVPVVPSFAGRPLHGYHVVPHRTSVDPPTVTVHGATGIIHALDGVRTGEIRVDGRDEPFVATVPLAPPPGVEVEPAGTVQVSVAIDEELVTRRLGSVPVLPRGEGPAFDPARWTVTPEEVDVLLTGGLTAVEEWMDRGVVAVVRIPPEVAAKGEAAELPVTVVGAPPGIGVRVSPDKVRVAVRR